MKMSKWNKVKEIASVVTGSLSVYELAPGIIEAGEKMYEFEKANPNLTPWYSINGGTLTALTILWLTITTGTYFGITALNCLMKRNLRKYNSSSQ